MELPQYRLFCATWGSFSPESGLPALRQTQANALALSTALGTLNALAGPPTALHDASGSACLGALDEFLATGEQDVILYFASHGLVPSGVNQFFRLATSETHDVADMMRAFLLAEAIDRVQRARGRRKLVIVDACYSGKAASSLLAHPVDLDLPGDICVLFATDPFTAAAAPENEALTAFTGALAETLMRGLPNQGPRLSVRSIYAHFESFADGRGLPKPLLVSTGEAAETISFVNASTGGVSSESFGERVEAFEHRTEILYIDDQESLREQFKEELEGAGHRVTLAANPLEGQEALAVGHYDIVVIDVLLEDNVPATDFIQQCARRAPDSLIFLVSRKSKGVDPNTKGTEQRWDRLDAIFAYPSRISAFLWKPTYSGTIKQHANKIRAKRQATLSRIEGLEEAVALVTERMIARDADLGARSERLRLEVRVCVERLVEEWFVADHDEHVYIESMAIRPVAGGRSASAVMLLSPTLRGIEAESVTPLVLKLGPAIDIKEEVRRYNRYVQVGVPLDFRTDKLNSALVGRVGGIVYSFRGADDHAIREVADLGPEVIEQCLRTMYGAQSRKRWTASRGTGTGINPVDHFARLSFSNSNFKAAVDAMRKSLAKIQGRRAEPILGDEVLVDAHEHITTSHPATLVHGDATLGNLVQISNNRFAIIDYRTVGLGPRLVDFATLEVACWVLAQYPEGTPRADGLLDAHAAVPRSLQVSGEDEKVADWLLAPARLAALCRELALFNHEKATDAEYGALLWLAAVRASYFRSRVTTTAERNTQRVILPAVALAAQSMMGVVDQ